MAGGLVRPAWCSHFVLKNLACMAILQPWHNAIYKHQKINMANKDGLLAILRVPKEQRVRCQAPGCQHSVYQRIHVVRLAGSITIYGSTCFKIHFEGHSIGSSPPSYSTVTGKQLSDEERAMLDSNTELLLQQLANEHADNVATEMQLRKQRERADQRWAPVRQAAQDAAATPLRPGFYDQNKSQLEWPELTTTDPVMRELFRSKREGKTRDEMLAAKGLRVGDPDFYPYSLLLAEVGFPF